MVLREYLQETMYINNEIVCAYVKIGPKASELMTKKDVKVFIFNKIARTQNIRIEAYDFRYINIHIVQTHVRTVSVQMCRSTCGELFLICRNAFRFILSRIDTNPNETIE